MDWENLGAEAWTTIADYGANVVGALLALFLGRIVAGWVRRLMVRAFDKSKFDATLARFFSNAARYAILTFTVLGVLGLFGVETSSFAAVIAAMGLAVGLAFQGTLSNFAAGVMLLVFRPFKVGELIEVGGALGTVDEIDLVTTVLSSLDNKKLTMPNSAIFGAQITNYTAKPLRRVDIDVGTDYGADLVEVRRVLEAMVPGIEGALEEPAPQVFLAGLGASSIDWQIRVWCETPAYWDVWQATIVATRPALDGAGVGIPFPQQDVHFDPELVDALRKSA